jgi:predicted aminopeptidase
MAPPTKYTCMPTMLMMFGRVVLVCAVLAVLPGCGTLYLAQAARGQWQVMRERQPIDKVVADERTPRDIRAQLTEVRDARDFASRELALPDNASYRSYSDIRRPFVVWNVVATPEFSIEPLQWCFPIAGCVAYRGYFSEKSARAFANKLQAKGFDVTVEGVAAYSTLGRVADPVLSTMLGYGNTELAAIIFHELSHQVIYVAGDSAFNEAFAMTVEQAGLTRWLKSRGREDLLDRYHAVKGRQHEIVELFMRRRGELALLYASKLTTAAMRERKRAIFIALAEDIRSLAKSAGEGTPYADWLAEGLNNAHLASLATYFDCMPGFERLLAAQEGNLSAFYSSVRLLAGKPRAERHTKICEKAP